MVHDIRTGGAWAADELPIEMIQTHISVVLLGRRHVLKLKKPVDFGFLDYTTLEKRRRACEAEVDLNRRLCRDTYIGVQPVTEAEGKPRLSGEGRIVDYGVLMKRLPADLMLDRMVAEARVSEAVIDAIAERLCAFHRGAGRGPAVSAYGSPEVIRRNWEENFTQTASYVGRTINSSAFETIRTWIWNWLESREELLRARVRDRWICDGHGDVRAESICVTNGICIFDCIEFNERFRCADVASEVAFLAMDLDARGRPDLGYHFSEHYQALSGDEQLFKLLPFYRCYRAFVRGKVLGFRLDEPEFSEAERATARERARSFFDLALRYARPLKSRTVIAVAGLSGTGKTALARAVAGELGLRVVSADAVRKAIFGDTRQAAYGEGPYSAEGNRLTYQKLVGTGGALLREDGGVVLDATFRRAADRALARNAARAAGAKWRMIDCRLPPDLIHSRLRQRISRREGFSDATWDTYLRQREEFEPLDESSDANHDANHFVLDTSGSLCAVGHTATDWLRKRDEQV